MASRAADVAVISGQTRRSGLDRTMALYHGYVLYTQQKIDIGQPSAMDEENLVDYVSRENGHSLTDSHVVFVRTSHSLN